MSNLIKSHVKLNHNDKVMVKGLCFNPTIVNNDVVYYTCGDDFTLREWSLMQRKSLNEVKTNID